MKRKHIIILSVLAFLLVLLAVFWILSDRDLDQNSQMIAQKEESLSELMNESEHLESENDALEEEILKAEERLKEERQKEQAQQKEEEEKPQQKEEVPETQRIAYLTFDDGVSKNTPRLLDILDEYGIKATFFPTWKPDYRQYYNLILARGHALGNHTASHDYSLVYSSLDNFKQDVTKLSDRIYEQTGVRPTLFRFPGGTSNTVNFNYNGHDTSFIPAAANWLTDEGYVYFDWNVDSGDASGRNYTAEELTNRVLAQAEGKDTIVVLMHDNGIMEASIEALPGIIEGLQEQGFEFRVLTRDTEPVRFNPAQ